jgi:hypothetical protein
MEAHTSVSIYPWKGAHYGQQSRYGVPVLVLGEAHYGKPGVPLQATLTQGAVQYWGQQQPSAFFTKTAKLLALRGRGSRLTPQERAETWEHIAFYNYIQELVGTSARIRPTKAMWEAARTPFTEVLAELKPRVLIVLGVALAAHVPQELVKGLTVCPLIHPASPIFSYARALPLVQDALAQARTAA